MNSAAPLESGRPLLSDATFTSFQRLVLQHTGIVLAEKKRSMFVNRFSKRLMALNISCYEDYLELISTPGHPETVNFIDTITTNLTYFFREPHHFTFLGENVLPRLAAEKAQVDPIRIWSAGCSSGQEPYSIAITVLNTPAVEAHQVKILSTDIHSKLVTQTSQGIYTRDQLRGLSQENVQQWFDRKGADSWQAKVELRNLLYSKKLNLFGPWPIRTGVDVIMCRNVLIYFSPAYQQKLINGFAAMQQSGSYLFIGHSETLEASSRLYRRVANTVFERV